MDDLIDRDSTIIQLTDQLALVTDQMEKATSDSNKKSSKIEDLRQESSKKQDKVVELRNQRQGLRNRLDSQEALHQAALEEKNTELTNIRELLDDRAKDMTTLDDGERES